MEMSSGRNLAALLSDEPISACPPEPPACKNGRKIPRIVYSSGNSPPKNKTTEFSNQLNFKAFHPGSEWTIIKKRIGERK